MGLYHSHNRKGCFLLRVGVPERGGLFSVKYELKYYPTFLRRGEESRTLSRPLKYPSVFSPHITLWMHWHFFTKRVWVLCQLSPHYVWVWGRGFTQTCTSGFLLFGPWVYQETKYRGHLVQEQDSFNLVTDNGAQRVCFKAQVHRARKGSNPYTIHSFIHEHISSMFRQIWSASALPQARKDKHVYTHPHTPTHTHTHTNTHTHTHTHIYIHTHKFIGINIPMSKTI
jgi:hypothetical protein